MNCIDQSSSYFKASPSNSSLIAACWQRPFCLAEQAVVKTTPMTSRLSKKLNKAYSNPTKTVKIVVVDIAILSILINPCTSHFQIPDCLIQNLSR